MNVISGKITALPAGLLSQLGRYRHKVFVETLGWDLQSPHGEDRDSNVLEVLIGRLRRKLDPHGNLHPIETLRGRGYRFALE